MIPALATSTSTEPSSASTRATAASTSSGAVMSHETASNPGSSTGVDADVTAVSEPGIWQHYNLTLFLERGGQLGEPYRFDDLCPASVLAQIARRARLERLEHDAAVGPLEEER